MGANTFPKWKSSAYPAPFTPSSWKGYPLFSRRKDLEYERGNGSEEKKISREKIGGMGGMEGGRGGGRRERRGYRWRKRRDKEVGRKSNEI